MGQSDWTRKVARSVEVTVETDESVLYHTANRQSSELEPTEQPVQLPEKELGNGNALNTGETNQHE
jgi:hypothetical protein